MHLMVQISGSIIAEVVIRGGEEWSPADMQRTFHLAVSDYGAALFLPRMLNDLRQTAPRTDLACIPADHRNVAVQLEAGTIDMGFCIVDTAYQGFCSMPCSQTVSSAWSAGHPCHRHPAMRRPGTRRRNCPWTNTLSAPTWSLPRREPRIPRSTPN